LNFLSACHRTLSGAGLAQGQSEKPVSRPTPVKSLYQNDKLSTIDQCYGIRQKGTQMSPGKRITDSSGLGSAHVRMAAEEAVDLVRRHYGFIGHLTRLETEKDDTFRLVAEDGREAVLKVANPGEDVAEIDLQQRLLDHLSTQDDKPPVPHTIPTIGGEPRFLHEYRAGQLRYVRMLSFLPGTQLSETSSSPLEREKVGEAL